jgi:hypothetical protein
MKKISFFIILLLIATSPLYAQLESVKIKEVIVDGEKIYVDLNNRVDKALTDYFAELDAYEKTLRSSNKKSLKYVSNVNWKQGNYVDEFGDDIKLKYIKQSTPGLFSNSATSNSVCYVEFLVDSRGKIVIFIREYSPRAPFAYFINGGIMSIKNSAGERCGCDHIYKWNTSGGLGITNNRECDIISFLKRSNGLVKVFIRDKYSTTYVFTINADGFTAACHGIGL